MQCLSLCRYQLTGYVTYSIAIEANDICQLSNLTTSVIIFFLEKVPFIYRLFHCSINLDFPKKKKKKKKK